MNGNEHDISIQTLPPHGGVGGGCLPRSRMELPAGTDGTGRADVFLRAGHPGEPVRALLHLARRTGEPLRLRLSLAPLCLRAAHRADHRAPAQRHQPRRDALRTAHRIGGHIVRGTARTGRAADTAHLHRDSYQQPPQHGLSVLHQRRNKYNNQIKEQKYDKE